MTSLFSTYEPPHSEEFSTKLNIGNGVISAEDELFVEKLLSNFVNKQSALFQRWMKMRIMEHKTRKQDYKSNKSHKMRYRNSNSSSISNNNNNNSNKMPKTQLLILTPLKIISLPSIHSRKRMKQFRIIDIVSLFVEENSNCTSIAHYDADPSKAQTPKLSAKSKILNKPKKQYNEHLKSPKKVRKYKTNTKQKRLRILGQIDVDKQPLHHATASSSSLSHSLSPQPSTSLEQNPTDAFIATIGTEDDADIYPSHDAHRPRKKANTFSYDIREESVSKSKSNSISKSKSSHDTSIMSSRSHQHSFGYGSYPQWPQSQSQLPSYNAWIYHCSIKFHKLQVLDMSYDKLSSHHLNNESLDLDIIDIYFENVEIAKEFLSILQFYLFTLYRGVPFEYKPKIEIIPHQLSDDKSVYPFVPSQVFIDRYVAYCDAQQIPALESVIDYVIHTNNDDIFDVAAAFSHHLAINNYFARNGTVQHNADKSHKNTHHKAAFSDEHNSFNTPQLKTKYSLDIVQMNDNGHMHTQPQQTKQTKNIQQQQYVALGHALAFLKMYKKLSVDRLNTDDANIATLMKIYETNPYMTACEFKKCAIKKITMQSLSISLRAGVANLKELSIVDINLTRSVLKDLNLENCNLSKLVMSRCNMSEKATVYLFNQLIKTKQYKSIQHLNISYNCCVKEGTKRLAAFIRQSLNIQKLIVNDARCDGNILFNGLHLNSYNNVSIKHHLEKLCWLDFSGNSLGDIGARKLSNFVQSARSLKCLKLSRCNISTQQLHKIFEGALANSSGLEDIDALNHDYVDNDEKKNETTSSSQKLYRNLNRSKSAGVQLAKYSKHKANVINIKLHYESHNVLLSYRPTRCDILQCEQLLRLTLDLSYNNLGTKGADVICELLRNRLFNGNIGNYTIVSLSLAGNNFDVVNLSNILRQLHCCVCLESLNISDNIKHNVFTANYFMKSMSKRNLLAPDKDEENTELLGQCLVNFCRQATNLERLIFNNNDLSVGLETFLVNIAYLSNLKYIDLSNNRFNDVHFKLLIQALSYNRTFIRALKINQNTKIAAPVLIEYLQLLSNHASLIDVTNCLPRELISRYNKVKKYSATLDRLENEASLNLGGNKWQYDIDKKMVSSLSWRERMEKQLRLQCGQQFGIPLESVRGSIKFVQYKSRIPQILVNLRNYLKTKGGFDKAVIFRFDADSNKFDLFKQDLNANAQNVKTDDMHSIANAIKDFYNDLPIKVLNNVNIDVLKSVESANDIERVMDVIAEPYKSLFEWLLDLCVDIVARHEQNQMSARSMAVVLCPSLFNAFPPSPTADIAHARIVMKFTHFAIEWRHTIYRVKHDMKFEEEFVNKKQTNPLNNMKRKAECPWKHIQKEWDSVMVDMNEDEMELQSWNKCNLDCDNDKDRFCYSIDRLTFILQYYKEWLIKRNMNPLRQSVINIAQVKQINEYKHRMTEFIHSLSSYSCVALLNDFNHCLRYHSSNEELEDIMLNLQNAMGGNGCCAVSQCACLIRNNRNRDRDENRPWKMKIYYGYKRSEEICTQQLLDKIHCYLFHTFDTLRLTKYEREKIKMNNIAVFKGILQPKAEKLVQLRGNHRVKGTKFSSNITAFVERINTNPMLDDEDDQDQDEDGIDEDDDDDDENDVYDDDVYGLGQPFNYKDCAPDSTNMDRWIVRKKYNNFKEEMLHNNIRQICCDSWNDAYFKALITQKTSIAKKIKMNKNNAKYTPTPPHITPRSKQVVFPDNDSYFDDDDDDDDDYDDYDEYETTPIQHLMAVLLYCDFDNLRFSLNSTLYPQSMDESITNWKLRNAEYYHWSAYLKDAVTHCNGIDLNENKCASSSCLTLYHAATMHTFLSPKPIAFCYPISFNKHLSIVDIFSPKNGIIFAMKYEMQSIDNTSPFNCCWISDYANYEEMIVFNSNNNKRNPLMRISNILNMSECANYQRFWNAINMLYCIINGQEVNTKQQQQDEEEDEEKEQDIGQDMHCLSLLIQYQIKNKENRTIPPYIASLFGSFCRDYIFGQIILNPIHLISLPILYKQLFDEYGWMKIDVFYGLFMNISSIKIMNVKLNESIFENLYKFLSQFSLFNERQTKRRGAMQKRRSSVLEIIASNSNKNQNVNNNDSIAQQNNSNVIDENTNVTDSPSSILSLKNIQFVDVNEQYMTCCDSVHKYYTKFNQIGWNITNHQSCLYIASNSS